MKKENERSLFEIMLKVAELGLLRTNATELAKMEGYGICWLLHNDGEIKITPNKILARLYVAPGKLGKWADITYSTLLDIYGTEDLEDFWYEYYLQDEFYQVYKTEKE